MGSIMFKILKFRFTPYLEYKSTTTNIKKVFKSKNFEIKLNFRLEVKFRLKLFNKKISVRSILTVRKNSLSNTPKEYKVPIGNRTNAIIISKNKFEGLKL